MTRRRLIGLDLNGVDDRMATAGVGVDRESQCVELGVRGSLVRLMAQDRWIAGRQNEAAPHGRGPAWGEVGDAGNRVELLALFERIRTQEPTEQDVVAIASALSDLTADGERAVFAAPDIPDWGEAFRDRFLGLLKRARVPRPLLLWRPVAALLGQLKKHPEGLSVDDTTAVLSLMADGVHLALLKLERGEDGSLPVPIRHQSGIAACASFRGFRLIDDAGKRLAEMSEMPLDEIRSSAWSPWRFATDAEQPTELLRLTQNHGWKELPKLQHRVPAPDGKDLPGELLSQLGEAKVMLVEGPFAGNAAWRGAVLAALRRRIDLPAEIIDLEAPTVVLGCLEAARRAREGQAIYFDFLPQLEINALVADKPEFVDLIAEGARCQGGQVFDAHAPDSYAINRGARMFTFWLFKQGSEHARKAEAQLPEDADRQYPLTVRVSQTPGQGSAEVTISSPEFEALRRDPIVLNWRDMTEVPATREQILEEISQQEGGLRWPETAVVPGHPMHWSDASPGDSLLALLASYRREPLVQNGAVHQPTKVLLKELRKRFSTPKLINSDRTLQSPRALNSDGTLPEPANGRSLPAEAERELDLTLGKLGRDLAALKRAFGPSAGKEILGDVVGFASWCFWRCPPGIADLLLDVYGDKARGNIHPILLREGVARVAGNRDRLERYFAAIGQQFDSGRGITTAEFAGLARTLGTAPEAAVILDRRLADHLLTAARNELEAENRKAHDKAYKRRLKSALLMLTALLRHRKQRRNFLDPESPLGKQLLSLLEETRVRNKQFAKQIGARRGHGRQKLLTAARRMIRNAKIVAKLQKFIRLQGSDRNLIEQIQAMPDTD